ncbi:MAG: hypothetical protein R2818_15050 [Flavobacteriales bacterium]
MSTQTVKVFVRVDGNGLRDGQYLAGTIQAGTVNDAFEVPRSAACYPDLVYTVVDLHC